MIDDQHHTKRGMLWLGSANLVTRILELGATLTVIAFLSREDMGTAAIVTSVCAVVESVSGMGLGQALIQAKNLTRDEEQSLFWLTVVIGLLLGLVMIILSPWIAYAYRVPVLLPMLAITSLKLLLVGAAVVPHQLLSKRLQFRESGAALTICSASVGLTKIILAVAGMGAWSLVLANVFRGVVLLITVLLLSGFRPRPHFVWNEVKNCWNFGLRIAGAGALYQCYRNADYFFVGKMLGVDALGVYRVAFDVGMQPLEVILSLVNRVSYPIYVKIADDAQALKRALMRSIRSMMLLGAPVVACLFFATYEILSLLTRDRWNGAVPAVKVLVWGSLLRGAAQMFSQIYAAAGKPNYAVIDSVVSMVVLVCAFWAGLIVFPQFGVLSVCWAWVVVYPGIIQMHLWLSRRIISLGTMEYLRALAPGVVGAAVMLLGMAVVTPFSGYFRVHHLTSFLVCLAIGLGTYASYLCYVLKINLRNLVSV
jgi:O-antigen/teichoic acid export membrane protein